MVRGLLHMTNYYYADYYLISYTDGKEPLEDLGYMFQFVGNPSKLSAGDFDINVLLEGWEDKLWLISWKLLERNGV